jgi:putative ABC transport system permease protein
MDSVLKDFAFALRTLRKGAGFTTMAVVTIALGIGACTAVFSVVNGVLLRPLPYGQPDRLVLIWSELRTRNVPDFPTPIPDLKDIRDTAKTLDGAAGMLQPGRTALSNDGADPEQVRTAAATSNLFRVLGVPMALGRDFVDEDGAPQPQPPPPGATATPGGGAAPPPPPQLPNMVVISHRLWQRRFGGDPTLPGRTIGFGNGRAEIVGVLPPDFELLLPPRTGIEPNIDVWMAARFNFETAARSTGALRLIARMKPDVTLAQAQSDLDGIAATLRERWPTKKNVNLHFRVVRMHDDLVRDVRLLVLSLFGAVGFVLLIACANVANLLLVRSSARQRELVIRSAVGGSRGRLVRQLMIETLVLAGVGGALGVALAFAGVGLLASLAPARLPRLAAVQVDGVVLLFTMSATLVTAVVCGLVPALRASRQNVADIVRASTPSLRAGRRLRYSVVLTEVALSFALLAGAGLMARSFIELQRVDPGYDPENVLTFFRPAARPSADERATWMRLVRERLQAIPGVVSAAAAGPMPLDGGAANIPWATREAGSVDPSAFRQANMHFVTPGYFETMKARLIDGRFFSDADNVPTQSSKVVVDEFLARQAYPGGSAVGRMLLVRNLQGGGPNAPTNVEVEIIGVVAHQRHETLTAPGREAMFFIDAYNGFGIARWAVRTTGDPMAVAPSVVAAVNEVDSRVPIAEVQPMRAFVDRANGPTRFSATMIGIFAVIALVLAAVGLYGVLSTTVRQRTGEIGMRMVCGAQPSGILRDVLIEGLRLSAIGVALGLAVTFSLTGLIRSMLVDVTPTDPLTFVVIVVVFFAVAVVATIVPARRASRVDPVVAMRQE